MKSATKSLHLSVLLGSCLLLTSGDLHAENQVARPVVAELTENAQIDARNVADTSRLVANALSEINLQETVPTPPASGSSAVEAVPRLSVPQPSPLGIHPPRDPCATCPHAGSGVLHDNAAVIGDGANIAVVTMPTPIRPYQHPAPEVVLRFSRGCTGAEFSNWSLSSRDAPRSRPVIPHGPLMIELRMDVEPVDFVELMLDGKLLKPTIEATVSPSSYEVPCPAAGRHVLQVRYLSGNTWSYYSNALQFDVRLPSQPRIIAASDSDRDPTPLVRHGITSITTGSIKVHLANVDRGDSIVAYVDGKPVSPQSGSDPCCRIFKVQGLITPGVHKLTVRAVGCPGSCSITSKPSNEVMFHYYDEDIYLLRPAAGCDNNSPALRSSCKPAQDASISGRRLKSLNPWEPGAAMRDADSKTPSEYTFVALLAANPKVEAAQLLVNAQKFRDLTASDVAIVMQAADATAERLKATSADAATAEQARDNARVPRSQAQQAELTAGNLAPLVEKLTDGELAPQKTKLQTAIANVHAAHAKAQEAYRKLEEAAKTARGRADACRSQVDAAVKANTAATELLRVANEALDRAKVFAKDAQLAQDVNGNATAAEQARQKTEVELGKIQSAPQDAAALIAPIQAQLLVATELRRLAAVDLAQAQQRLQLVQNEAKTVWDEAALAQTVFKEATALAGHLRNPGYLMARSYSAAAEAAHDAAEDAAQRAISEAANAKANADRARSVADTAHARSTDLVDAIARTSIAEREALAAAQRADAAVRQADIEAARFPINSPQANVAHRDATAARAERDAAYKAATKARAAYYAALHNAAGVAAGAVDADRHAKETLTNAADAQVHAQAAVAARDAVQQARIRAEKAATQLLEALEKGNNVAVVTANSTQQASAAKIDAERQALEAKKQTAEAIRYATAAKNSALVASADGDRAGQVAKAASQANDAEKEAIDRARFADTSAARGGLTHKLQGELKDAWDNAEVKATRDALLARVREKASGSTGNVDVQRAEDGAGVAELLAARAEARSAARIREYEANARTARANKVKSVPSPFYFASAAHFPIPESGLRGEAIEREGVVIYEDMKLSFDRDGNYEVHSRQHP